jgi:SAM-dependent methyltransferase
LNLYRRHVLPFLVDTCCGATQIQRLRTALLPTASGRVLEVGIGSGRNLPFYDAGKVRELVGVDPSRELWARARPRLAAVAFPVRHHATTLDDAPIEAASIDTAVITYTLCTLPDPLATLQALRPMLAPGAQLLFCEHGVAPDPSVRRWQHRLNGLWRRLAGGCNLDRDIPALLRGAGFAVEVLTSQYLPGVPRIAGFHCWGAAKPIPR